MAIETIDSISHFHIYQNVALSNMKYVVKRHKGKKSGTLTGLYIGMNNGMSFGQHYKMSNQLL